MFCKLKRHVLPTVVKRKNNTAFYEFFRDEDTYPQYNNEYLKRIYDIQVKGTESMINIDDTLVIGGNDLLLINKSNKHKSIIKNVNLLTKHKKYYSGEHTRKHYRYR